MAYRRRMKNKGKDGKVFSRTASKVSRKNKTSLTKRGGIRL